MSMQTKHKLESKQKKKEGGRLNLKQTKADLI